MSDTPSQSVADQMDALPARSVRLKFPIAVSVLAGIAHIAVYTWADGDLSIINGLGMVIWLLAGLVVTGWFLIFSGAPGKTRLAGLGLLTVAFATLIVLFRWDGQTGDFVPKFTYRFAPSAEERVIEYFRSNSTSSGPIADRSTGRLELTDADWPRFAGANEDQIVRGVTIRKDWNDNPPIALWRHPVGPAWSSFAIVDNFAFTQEQRGADEAVVCYHALTGEQLWMHTDPVRFEEAASGVGPRCTPTIDDSRLYALGATGILNCLNPLSGEVLWTRNIVADAKTDLVMYGMAGSPLVHQDLVIVSPSGDGAAVAAYDRLTGEPRWSAGKQSQSYASPLVTKIAGVPQVLIYSGEGLCGHDLSSGERLWMFDWTNVTKLNLAQPIVLPDQSVLISSGYGSGSARLDITLQADVWKVEPRWVRPNRFKLKFNGGILRDGFVYGLDEGILSCIDVSDGERKWKKGRYRFGQMLAVADDLLVVTEQGKAVLVAATPQDASEIAEFQAIEGKTWNHPVLNRGLLFVRNSQEAACYDLRPQHSGDREE